jgi:serine/threonine-protein kinase
MSTITESIGRVLAGRYRIESALGSGASANVFAAFDTTLQRRVAVKVLHPALATDGGFLRRFRSEAQSAAALTNPHVLAVYDWGEDVQGPFLVLEFLGGGSLRDMLDQGTRLSVSQAVAVGVQAAEGLAYAHGRGFVHRDVKPANLLFDVESRLRVADFGLARAISEAAMTEPEGTAVGTARYAAPEQAQGLRTDGRADVYALALVLYESVTGVVPFTADTVVATLQARVGAQLPPHDALGPLAAVLAEAATPDVGNRLQAPALAAKLRALAAELPAPEPLRLAGAGGTGIIPARTDPVPDRDLTQHGMGAPAQAQAPGRRAGRGGDDPDVLAFAAAVGLTEEPTVPRRRRRRWPWVAAILVVAVAVLGAGTDLVLQKTKLLTPSHALPSVTGLSTTQAGLALRHDHFVVDVVGHTDSITAPLGQILSQNPRPGKKLKEGSSVAVVLSAGPPPVTVPVLTAVTGDCPAITALLAKSHLQTACTDPNSTSVSKGKVIDWNPKGTATYGSTITVAVSAGPPMESIASLTGQTCTGATTTLQAVGLVGVCSDEYTTTGVQSGEVISWSPTGQAPEGSTVTILISEGPPLVTVPAAVVGETVAEAITTLESANLVPGTDQGPLSGQVFDSDPAPGAQVPEGSTVTLYSR